MLSLSGVPEGPAVPTVTVRGFDPVAGDASAPGVAGHLPGRGWRRRRGVRGVGGGGGTAVDRAGRRRGSRPGGRAGHHAGALGFGGPGRRGAAEPWLRGGRRRGGGVVRVRHHGAPGAAPHGAARGPVRRTAFSTIWRRATSWSTASTEWRASTASHRGPLPVRPVTTSCCSTGVATASTCRWTRSRR